MFHKHSSPGPLSLHAFRIRLARPEALPELTILGLITGVLAGGLLIGFREVITLVSDNTPLPGDEGFAGLPPLARLALPIAGALLVITLVRMIPPERRSFGITHVIQNFNFNRGRFPFSNLAIQFFSALVALVSGFSVGREGPAVHMGAGAGSIMGEKFQLPDNCLRALAGCGSAAAISASFNTPMAGVIFAMEVIMREYSLGSFIPVTAASVTAALMSQMVYGVDPAFVIPVVPMVSLDELGVTVMSACFIGGLAAAFIKLNLWVAARRQGELVKPLLVAGLLMGVIGMKVPEVMGVGYDTIGSILGGQVFTINFLLTLVLVKLCITAVVIGLGVPGGVIGPSLFIGASAGAMFTTIGAMLFDLTQANSVYHALIGMVAMMAAVLQAPLAALMTVLEMTRNPHIIMPAMLAIIIACLVASQVFRQHGLFTMQLKVKGQMLGASPLQDVLCKAGVAGLMNTNIQIFPRHLSLESLQQQLAQTSEWIVFDDGASGRGVLAVSSLREATVFQAMDKALDLCSVQGVKSAKSISLQASLDDALKIMNQYEVDALYIQTRWKQRLLISGVITRQDIEAFYS